MTNKTQFCSVCGSEFTGWGNNARPINNGTCCDSCNQLVVRHRFSRMQRNLPMRISHDELKVYTLAHFKKHKEEIQEDFP